jgi:hypothetical protein
MELVGLVAAFDADHGVEDGRLDERHVQDVVRRCLGGVGHQGRGGQLVPVADHGWIVGIHCRRCRCGGRTRGQGGEDNGGRERSQPTSDMRLPAAG